MQSTISTDAVSERSKLAPALAAMFLGAVILFGVGFLQGPQNAVHNAAHDTRHSMGFPCH